MGQKFQNKYRIPSTRAQWWDYGNNAAYFITICTANRKHYFGDIRNGKMELSPIGIKYADFNPNHRKPPVKNVFKIRGKIRFHP